MIDPITQQYIADINLRYQQQQASVVRYARYMTDETPAAWRERLGDDVILLTHGAFTARIVDQFVADTRQAGVHVSSADERDLQVAAMIHDWGEITLGSEGIGDISFDQKTDRHEVIEGNIFTRVITVIPDEQVRADFARVYSTIVRDRRSPVGMMFNAIERIGYMHTALRAFQGDGSGRRIANWRGLAGNALSNQMEQLLVYSGTYPAVANFLKSHAATIQLLYEELASGPIPTDHAGGLSFDGEKLHASRHAWNLSAFAHATNQ